MQTYRLHAAVRSGNDTEVRSILEHINSPDCRDRNGCTPLYRAVESEYLQKVQILIDVGKADVNLGGPDGQVPLHVAAKNNYIQIVPVLIAGGAKLNITDNNRWTALHYAAWCNKPEMVKLLIQQKATLDIRDNEGKTPVDLAIKNKYGDVVALFPRINLYSPYFTPCVGKDPCSICLEDEPTSHVSLSCGHTFHEDCITEWFKQNKTCTCAICRGTPLKATR
jgi:hypothetical protein